MPTKASNEGENRPKNIGVWHFDPNWLVTGEEGVDELQFEATEFENPGSRAFSETEFFSSRPNSLKSEEGLNNYETKDEDEVSRLNRRAFEDKSNHLTKFAHAHAKEPNAEECSELLQLRRQVKELNDKLGKKDVFHRHLAAQNLALQNEVSKLNRELSLSKQKIQSLNDHVIFLRHVTAPTPDAGALDASLALLRGHELERSRAKEFMLQEQNDLYLQQKRQLEHELEYAKLKAKSVDEKG